MNRIFGQRGNVALKRAKDLILLNCKSGTDVSKALRYFSEVTLQNALPVFPALISLACETVGDDPKKTIPFATAIVLVTGAADLHDDVIDKTFKKGSKLTVLGKFGAPIAILAGDVLLSQGMSYLQIEINRIQTEKGESIKNILREAFLEICNAEASEYQQIKRHRSVLSEESYGIINQKAVVPELAMKIGAIIGNGDPRSIETLGQIGRTFGIVSLIIEEFTDIFDRNELRNRIESGYPPLPIIYALQDTEAKKALLPLLNNSSAKGAHHKIIETVVGCSKVQDLIKKNLTSSVNRELLSIKESRILKKQEEIETLFLALLNYLNDFF